MSLLLYNPLEALLLILCIHLFVTNEKINNLGIIRDSYFLGTIFFLAQNFSEMMPEPIIPIYCLFCCFVVTPVILMLYCKIDFTAKNIEQGIKILFIEFSYFVSSTLLIFLSNLPLPLKEIAQSPFLFVFISHIRMKIIQYGILLIILGGIYLKKFLTLNAKKKIGKSVASTQLGWGEPKLSKKLQDEIK